MPLPNVKITLASGQLGGVLQTEDGIAGLVLTGVSEGSGIVAGTPILFTSLTNAAVQGLTATNNAFAWKQVKEFYDEAGTGAQLYVMLVPATMKVNQVADKTNANGAIKLLNFAGGKIRLLGILTNDTLVYTGGTTLTTTNAINADCYTAATNMQALGAQFFAAQTPFRAVIGGTSFTGVAASLTDETTATSNRVSVLIGDTVSGNGSAVGLLLGRAALIPVQRKISRVRDGALTAATAFIGAVSADQYTNTETLFAKGFITFRTFPNKSGFYFSGDATCASTADDYSSLARGRVIDKAQVLAYATFANEVDDEVPVDASGNIDAGYTRWLEQQITNQVNLAMTAGNEISAVSCFIDPAQNILSTGKLNVVLKVTPVGYASDIEVQLGF